MKLSILVWFLCFAVLTVCLLLYRVCLHAPQNVEMTLRQHVVQVLPYMLSDMWPLLIFVSSLTCLGTESLMVGVCSASNRHVLMDKTHPTEEGSVTLRRFFCSLVLVVRSTVHWRASSLCPPTGVSSLCPTSQSRRLWGSTWWTQSDANRTPRNATVVFPLSVSLSPHLRHLFCFVTSPSTPVSRPQTCLFVKRN